MLFASHVAGGRAVRLVVSQAIDINERNDPPRALGSSNEPVSDWSTVKRPFPAVSLINGSHIQTESKSSNHFCAPLPARLSPKVIPRLIEGGRGCSSRGTCDEKQQRARRIATVRSGIAAEAGHV